MYGEVGLISDIGRGMVMGLEDENELCDRYAAERFKVRCTGAQVGKQDSMGRVYSTAKSTSRSSPVVINSCPVKVIYIDQTRKAEKCCCLFSPTRPVCASNRADCYCKLADTHTIPVFATVYLPPVAPSLDFSLPR